MINEENLPEGWKVKDLQDIIYFQEGPGIRKWQFTSEGIKLINVKNLVNGSLELNNTDRHCSKEEVDEKYSHFLLEEKDIVMASSGVTWGKTAIVEKEHLPLMLNTSVIRFRSLDRNILIRGYLLLFLNSVYFKRQIERMITGGCQPNFGPFHLKKVKFILPPLETQKKIVETLERAQKLKEWRDEVDELANGLFNSFFLKMFGDPVKNEKEFKTDLLKNLCQLKSGGTPSRKNKEYFEGNIPWITTVALGPKFIDSKDAIEYITEYAIEKSATKLIPKDSIMVGVRVGVGKASINKCEMCTNQDIMSLVNIDKRLDKDFLLQILRYYEKFFESQVRGATIKGITSSTLKELNIILPPMELQEKFAEIVKQVEKLRKSQKQSKQQIDNLFNTLMQKAFKGELTC